MMHVEQSRIEAFNLTREGIIEAAEAVLTDLRATKAQRGIVRDLAFTLERVELKGDDIARDTTQKN